jgi:hypothetical protein
MNEFLKLRGITKVYHKGKSSIPILRLLQIN